MEVYSVHPEHLLEINGWLDEHGRPPLDLATLPAVGGIVPGVAVGFLYQSEPGVGYVENFATNPRAPRAERSRAVSAIVDWLEEKARQCCLRRLVVLTQRRSIVRRALRLGYSPGGAYAVLSKSLEG